jgi:hypothetical protein
MSWKAAVCLAQKFKPCVVLMGSMPFISETSHISNPDVVKYCKINDSVLCFELSVRTFFGSSGFRKVSSKYAFENVSVCVLQPILVC